MEKESVAIITYLCYQAFIALCVTIVLIRTTPKYDKNKQLQKGKEEIDIKIELEKYKKTQRHKSGL